MAEKVEAKIAGMNKKLLKKYATTSRQKLLSQITQVVTKLNKLSLHDIAMGKLGTVSYEPAQLAIMQSKLLSLQEQIKSQTIASIAEQISYTCFNQLNNLRFIELHGWLPELSNNPNQQKVLWQNSREVLKQLKQIHNNYPDFIIVPDFVSDFFDVISQENVDQILQPSIEELCGIPESNFNHTEILGWLYQYYNSDEKLHYIKLKKPYAKSTVPIVTQIFTPDFIVKYMVENSLGQILLQKDAICGEELNYHVDALTQNVDYDVEVPELKILDPCCGSGHILLYAFEILFNAYQRMDFDNHQSVQKILRDNLFGLDVDDFAVQISKAALYFKAREYDPDFFQNLSPDFEINVHAIPESNSTGRAILTFDLEPDIKRTVSKLMDMFANAKEIGSLLTPPLRESFEQLEEFLSTYNAAASDYQRTIFSKLSNMLTVVRILQAKYDVVTTNPPYINTLLMNAYLKRFVTKNFDKYRRDTFACFVRRCQMLTKPDGYFALMTPNVWLSTTSFTSLRDLVLNTTQIKTLLALAPSAFFAEAAVDVVAFVLRNSDPDDQPGVYVQLSQKSDLDNQSQELRRILAERSPSHIHQRHQQIFNKLPDQIIPFAADEKLLQTFRTAPTLASYAEPRQGIITGDNAKFLRYWFEVALENLGVLPVWFHDGSEQSNPGKWLPHNKGGSYRKWYGNHDYVIDWSDNGRVVKKHQANGQQLSRIQNLDYNFRPAISWSAVTSGDFAVRFYDEQFTFNVAGPSCFAPPNLQNYIMGFLNSCVAASFTAIINPTMNFNVGDIAKVPLIFDQKYQNEINQLVNENIQLAKEDWDMFATSWNFTKHPLLTKQGANYFVDTYKSWRDECESRFTKLKQNEERLNQIFIKIYQLEQQLSPEIADEKISLSIINQRLAAKTFLSYFVGASLGRFGYRDAKQILSYDTIVDELRDFLEQTCGASNVQPNLTWLAEALGKSVGVQDEEFLQQYFVTEFYYDHLKTYHGRPIYWQFDAGPEQSLRGIFYVHGFDSQILKNVLPAKIQTTQEALLTQLNLLETRKNSSPIWPTERKRLEDSQSRIINKMRELNDFSQKLSVLTSANIKMDADLGIAQNYAKLAPILTELRPSRYMQKKQEIIHRSK